MPGYDGTGPSGQGPGTGGGRGYCPLPNQAIPPPNIPVNQGVLYGVGRGGIPYGGGRGRCFGGRRSFGRGFRRFFFPGQKSPPLEEKAEE